ncbi:unnamed protein product [Darwinula stevensoni]|uniref:Daxx histone-binding domain-containing protein n=1 Tax=Darwinula stevensoni TaxID=69355 RepID=A0A7R9A434_9CRUS|nr:unnamed protein product [Darwinula stevensoni]CAG0889186.1 unnamed protein product [Darwinula stevensoni]
MDLTKVEHRSVIKFLTKERKAPKEIHEPIAVDLKGRSKKSLEKLQKIFKKNVLTADILLNWEPHDAKICPSSLAAYLDNLGLVVSEEKVRLQEKIFYSVPSPKFGPTDVERAEEILDWMGSLASREPSLGKHPRVPETADENSDVIVYGQILQLTSLGLLLRSHIYSIMEKLQSMLEAEKVTWVGLQVLGYPDTSDPLGGQYKSEESVGERKDLWLMLSTSSKVCGDGTILGNTETENTCRTREIQKAEASGGISCQKMYPVITITDDDDQIQEKNHKHKIEPVDEGPSKIPRYDSDDGVKVKCDSPFEEYLHICAPLMETTGDKKLLEKLRRLYKEVTQLDNASIHELEALVPPGSQIPSSTSSVIQSLVECARFMVKLKESKTRARTCVPKKAEPSAENSESAKPAKMPSSHTVKKLEKALRKLEKAIKKLDEQDVDFDDDCSTYILSAKLKKKALKIYQELAKFHSCDPDPGRPTKSYVHFKASSMPDVNKKLEKLVNRNQVFPDYRDVLNIVRKANMRHNLHYSKGMIETEARKVFLSIGRQLQSRRQLEEAEDLFAYGGDENASEIKDPADEDQSLATQLSENAHVAEEKLVKLYNEYADKQDSLGLQPEEVPDDAGTSSGDEDNETARKVKVERVGSRAKSENNPVKDESSGVKNEAQNSDEDEEDDEETDESDSEENLEEDISAIISVSEDETTNDGEVDDDEVIGSVEIVEDGS